MPNRKPIPQSVKRAIRDKCAWPGGYPLHIVMHDGACLCVKCARENWRLIAHSTVKHSWPADDWRAIGAEVNWEDAHMECEHCGARIESAYAEPEPQAV